MNIPLFISTPLDLFEVYLRALPREARQYHRCNECRKFINKYGRLLIVNADGSLRPIMWDADDAPEFYKKTVRIMADAVVTAGIESPFVCRDTEWGERTTGAWSHFGMRAPTKYVAPFNPIKSEHQLMAEKMEDYKNVQRALRDFDIKTLDLALALLKSDALYRSEKVLAPAEWLHGIAHQRASRTRNFGNKLWVEVTIAPAGFCHPRSSMIGSLLEDIESKGLDAARKAFAAKMHPLAYQRPQAAPSEQTIDRAEKLFEQLGLAPALMRRIAKPSDIPEHVKLWVPRAGAHAKTGGVFDSLRGVDAVDRPLLDGGVMTYAKFCRDILPHAQKIEVRAPEMAHFTVLCTAVDPHAKPVLRWDSENPSKRNPFNWYVWHGGSSARDHFLTGGAWSDCYAITDRPCFWSGLDVQGFPPSVFFFLAGAGEKRSSGSALFPEVIRSDLHEVRSVIERYSRLHNLPAVRDAAVALSPCQRHPLEVRVTGRELARVITIDRMD